MPASDEKLRPVSSTVAWLHEWWPLLMALGVIAYAVSAGWHAGSVVAGVAAALTILLSGGTLLWWMVSGENWHPTACCVAAGVLLLVSVSTSPLFNMPLQQGLADVLMAFNSPALSFAPGEFKNGGYQDFQRIAKHASVVCAFSHLNEAMASAGDAAEAIYVDPLLAPLLPSPDAGPHSGTQCARDYMRARAIAPWVFSGITGAERNALEQRAKTRTTS